MFLCIDNGNTTTKLGWFLEGTLQETCRIDNARLRDSGPDFLRHQVYAVILSSTGDFPAEIRNWFGKDVPFFELSHQLQFPVRLDYRSPETLGKDRLAAVVAAWELNKWKNTLVIDAGTCITYDLVREDGTYPGGVISPGIRMRLEAMHQMTARLPLVDLEGAQPLAFGTDTRSCLQSGAAGGAILEMESWIHHFRKESQVQEVLLTGGDAQFFAAHLKTKVFLHPELTLMGLYKILRYNASHL